MAENDVERLNNELQRALDDVKDKTPPHMRPPTRTKLGRWAIALRVMAWIWWLGGLAYFVPMVVGLDEAGVPAGMAIAAMLRALFLIALGGMLLYAYSHHLVGIDCIVENTAPTAEAALAAQEAATGESDDADDRAPFS